MYLKRIIWIAVIIAALGFSARRPGVTSLLIPPTARATGMAYVFTAIADDASANYYNAAGLAFLKSPALTATYFNNLPGLHPNLPYIYFGGAYPLVNSAWGFDLIWHTEGCIEIIDFDGNYLGKYWLYDVVPKLNYSHRIKDEISLE